MATLNNPNSEPTQTVVIVRAGVVPALIGGTTEIGAWAGPAAMAGDSLPARAASYLIAKGWAQS